MSTAEHLAGLTDEERARIKDLGDVVEVTLVEPITYQHSKFDGERTLPALTLSKRVKGKHMKAMDKVSGDVSQGLALIGALAGVPPVAMDELDARDLGVIEAVISPFLPKSLRTGTDSSE